MMSPENIALNFFIYNEHNFRPSSAGTLQDLKGRFYKPLQYDTESNSWIYACRVSPRTHTPIPELDEEIVLINPFERFTSNDHRFRLNASVFQVFFQKQTDDSKKISKTCGIVFLQANEKTTQKNVEKWHKILSWK